MVKFQYVQNKLTPRFLINIITTEVRMATNDKYDRQLRLWGANGQRALMNAHILLIRGIIISCDVTFISKDLF